jgi:dipeptide/tripeptide permease
VTRALLAGAAYFAIVFAAGFVLGALRVALVAPLVGETSAVVVELPVILTASWIACGWCVRRFGVAETVAPRLLMGAIAFALLMLAELCLSVVGLNRTFAEHVAALVSRPGLIGLAGQALFALFPALQALRKK